MTQDNLDGIRGASKMKRFFGYDRKDYTSKAAKALIAGGFGVLVGSVIQTFLNPTGLPLFLTNWMGALFGFVVNFNVQVIWKNIHVERAK